MKTINLPFLADSINEGTVAQLLKSSHFFIQRKENGLTKMRLLPTLRLTKSLLKSKALMQVLLLNSMSKKEIILMLENLSSMLIPKESRKKVPRRQKLPLHPNPNPNNSKSPRPKSLLSKPQLPQNSTNHHFKQAGL